MALKIFVDFDGTITWQDVGNAFFFRFVGERYEDLLKKYKEENIAAAEFFRGGVEAIGKLNKQDATSFVRSLPIDESFKRFVDFCRLRGIEFHVVSDGLDFYIQEILSEHRFVGISVFANKLEFVPASGDDHDHLRLSFPYSDAECRRCACCKRNIMLTHAGEDDVIAYVGEGYSDRCPVQYADIVFAKDFLQTFCQEQNISYFLYDSFDDVVDRLESLVSKKRLRKRLAADAKRKELFIAEP
jgi:2-hydroxy-3-keto-5-methylthiopentenyl-1-phosphate phosphatase